MYIVIASALSFKQLFMFNKIWKNSICGTDNSLFKSNIVTHYAIWYVSVFYDAFLRKEIKALSLLSNSLQKNSTLSFKSKHSQVNPE